MTTRLFNPAIILLSAALASGAVSARDRRSDTRPDNAGWTRAQLAELQSLSLAALDPLPADATNRVADDPRAARLGRQLFFDTRLSSNGQVSCATCHQPGRTFQDGLPLAKGVGMTARRAMPIAGMARSPFLFWDGRKDSLWAQALGPLESPVEHGGTRAQYAHVIAAHYARDYEAIFGAVPDLSMVPPSAGPVDDAVAAAAWRTLDRPQQDAVTGVFVNIGKAIAAYERQLAFAPARFDAYVAALAMGQSGDELLSGDAIAGLRLFIGRANCTQCHNGPLFTSSEFHNTGVPPRKGVPLDRGRLTGATTVLHDEFNCRSRWSDARDGCAELAFMITDDHELDRAYKVPSLRNVAERPPYMDAGQIGTLSEVIDHYNRAPVASIGHSDLRPLRLTAAERRQLEAFLHTLSAPVVDPVAE